MGICTSTSTKRPLTPKCSCNCTAQTQGEFYPPPNLLRKSSQSPLIKEKKELFQCVSGFELNSILEQGGNIESNLSVLISKESLRPENINQTNVQLLFKISRETEYLSTYKEQDLIGKIFDEFEGEIIEKYGELIKDIDLWNKAEISFCTDILFQATEIYQVLLSFKKKNKKKKEKANYWWLPPLVNFSDAYDETDTYTFMKKKIGFLGTQLKVLFTSTLGAHTESKVMKKESCMIEGSEMHQAKKCEGYTLSKAPVGTLIHV